MRVPGCRLLALFLIVLAPALARAGEALFPDLEDTVAGSEGVTYVDLSRLVLPGLEPDGTGYRGSEIIGTRHLGGKDMGASPPDEFVIYDVAALPIRAGGRDRLLLLFDLGLEATAEGFAILALFDTGTSPSLLDAAQVGFDRHTYFRAPASLPLDGGNDLVLTMSTHFNSSQAYVFSAMIGIREERLELIDTVFTFDDRACGFERRQKPEFTAAPGAAGAHADIAVRVVETTSHSGDACDDAKLPPEGSRAVETVYQWDAARSQYRPASDALERLARENEARF